MIEPGAIPTCGGCGVYRDLHPTRTCEKPRLSFWWDRHFLWRHLAGRAWLALPEKARWKVVGWIYDHQPNLCWCDLVDAAYIAHKRDDFTDPHGCACDIPLPFDARIPSGNCYCPTDEEARRG